jgi:hypothetical protein
MVVSRRQRHSRWIGQSYATRPSARQAGRTRSCSGHRTARPARLCAKRCTPRQRVYGRCEERVGDVAHDCTEQHRRRCLSSSAEAAVRRTPVGARSPSSVRPARPVGMSARARRLPRHWAASAAPSLTIRAAAFCGSTVCSTSTASAGRRSCHVRARGNARKTGAGTDRAGRLVVLIARQRLVVGDLDLGQEGRCFADSSVSPRERRCLAHTPLALVLWQVTHRRRAGGVHGTGRPSPAGTYRGEAPPEHPPGPPPPR